ncbi:MAG: hypothetical protein BGO41_02690 [Clostridiales bacterium 38-18]|nr:MAG: hypothetical protein BGO41_02690 [Clostridiales bacterium 38-18]
MGSIVDYPSHFRGEQMKISAFLQNIQSAAKASTQTTTGVQAEKSVSETLLQDYKKELPSSVASLYDKYQMSPTSDEVKGIQSFLKNSSASKDNQLMSIDIALYKGISPSEENLQAISQALDHDQEVVASLTDMPTSETPLTKAETLDLIDRLQLPRNLTETLKQMVKEGTTLKAAVKELAKAFLSSSSSNTSDTTKLFSTNGSELKNTIELLAALKDVFSNLTQDELLSRLSQGTALNAKLIALIGSQLEKLNSSSAVVKAGEIERSNVSATFDTSEVALKNASFEAQIGSRENDTALEEAPRRLEPLNQNSLAREEYLIRREVMSELVPNEISEAEAKSESKSEATDYTTETDGNTDIEALIEAAIGTVIGHMTEVFESIQASFDFKTYLIEQTTEATIRAKQSFEQMKSEMTALLEPEAGKLSAQIGTAIDKLNKFILKSDVTLMVDMYTEKKLITLSSELEKASGLVQQGKLKEAQNVVNEGIKLLKSIEFQPSQRRLQVFAAGKGDAVVETLVEQEKTEGSKLTSLDQSLRQAMQNNSGNKLSREVLETLRYLGLNHEVEVADAVEKLDFETLKDRSNTNVKELLLKMMNEDKQERTVTATEQNLMNLNGQQMMNDSQTGKQPFYFFNVPIMDGEDLGNVKIFMKGASKNAKIDWQNTEIYFGMKLNTLGTTGIRVKITQGQLDVSVTTEHRDALESELNSVMSTLSELGFKFGSLAYSSSSTTELNQPLKASEMVQLSGAIEDRVKTVKLTEDGKGFDFKI